MTPDEHRRQWYRDMQELFKPTDVDWPVPIYLTNEQRKELATHFGRLALGKVVACEVFTNAEGPSDVYLA